MFNLLITYLEYQCLGKTDKARVEAYHQLFKHHIPDRSVANIRKAKIKLGCQEMIGLNKTFKRN